MINVWGYSETSNKYGGSGHIRYVGRCHRGEFIDTVLGGHPRGRSWVADRTGVTGNEDDIRLALANPGKVIVIDDPMSGPRCKVLRTLDIIKFKGG